MIEKEFQNLIKQLQKKIEQDEERTYSKVVINEYHNPCYFGILTSPDAIGQIKGPCGDTMKISLKIKNNIITNARFWTDGCGATIASGNMLIKMILRKTLHHASKITSTQLLIQLGGLPNEHHHCARLAIRTLRNTIKMYNKNIKTPRKTQQ